LPHARDAANKPIPGLELAGGREFDIEPGGTSSGRTSPRTQKPASAVGRSGQIVNYDAQRQAAGGLDHRPADADRVPTASFPTATQRRLRFI